MTPFHKLKFVSSHAVELYHIVSSKHFALYFHRKNIFFLLNGHCLNRLVCFNIHYMHILFYIIDCIKYVSTFLLHQQKAE